MTAKLLDGKALSETIQAEIAESVRELKAQHNLIPGLAVIMVGDNPASAIYVRNKSRACEKIGMYSESLALPAATAQAELLRHIQRLNQDPGIHGILVQLPLPDHINENAVILSLDPAKDVDGFHPLSVGRMTIGKEDTFLPCTPYGIQTLLVRSGIRIEGSHVVIVGRSNIVGKPTAIILMQKAGGADATVTVCHSRTRDLPAVVRQGDIVIAAMGRPRFITRDMIKPGAVVIDVGMNRIPDASTKSGYKLVGDVDFEAVKEVAGAITPVPGGVGPMTIAMLLSNTLKAAIRNIR
jgi:methylenetetrahydrofolate dehydrogenase (NADP+)/methenyltetrahydrofolate cyclohydrolase